MSTSQVFTEGVIARPVDAVWKLIARAERFEYWCDRFWFEGGAFHEGSTLTLVIRLAGPLKVRVPVTVTVFEKENELRWEATAPGGFRGSHWIRVEKLGENETRVMHGEDFDGLSAVWPVVSQGVHEEYQAATDALIRYLERAIEA